MSKKDTFVESILNSVKIKSIKRIKNTDKVYDLTVEDSNTYCTGDFIVGHNSDMGNRAKETRSFFKQNIRKMQKLNICAVFTAHLTDNIGGYGPTKIVSGGTVLGYAPSIEVRFAKVNAESDVEQSAIGAKLVKIRADIQKSRLGTYGKRVKFDLDMENGLDPYAGISDILKDYGLIIPAVADIEEQIKEKTIPKKSTGWWMFKPFDDPMTQKMHKIVLEKELSKSGKFRESEIKSFCENRWFLEELQKLLDKTLESSEEIIDTIIDTREVSEEEKQQLLNEIADLEETPKKRKKVEISEV